MSERRNTRHEQLVIGRSEIKMYERRKQPKKLSAMQRMHSKKATPRVETINSSQWLFWFTFGILVTLNDVL
jgi:hypothetical protein